MNKLVIAGIGELLWDVLPHGEALGGAPANFSYHINSLGGRGIPISTIGDDGRGQRSKRILQDKGVELGGIVVTADYPTGWVDATIDNSGIATYSFPDDVAWDHLVINDFARDLQSHLDAICFGSLAQRSSQSRAAVHDYLDSLGAAATLRVFDINLRQDFYTAEIIRQSLARADVLKLNEDELVILATMFSLQGEEGEQLAALRDTWDLQLVILTRGGSGSLLLTKQAVSNHPGIMTSIVDTIGAGDSFTAAATIGFLQGQNLDAINEHANKVAAYVCTRHGAMPELPEMLKMRAA